MIRIEALRKHYGEVRAVDGVSFEAPDGCITGLLGPNGAGKTTTLRILCSLVKPDAGRAEVDGVEVQRDPMGVLRRIGVLPDGRGLYGRLTAREHIEYFGRLQGVGAAELARRVEALAELLGMEALLDRRVAGFSRGERTKVAIARALVHRPRTVVLDEPTNGLDVMSTRAMREVIRRLRDEGCCVLFSSHIMQEVSALCDHVVVMARGKVAAEGAPEALRTAEGAATLEEAFVRIIGTREGLQ
ncbi:MAG: ATP-binding cassette domain-containing protein [Deltaproteobacteria bacterium]|nr:MAG: ATP-binding cassette domain-containing protein [Deltaproteobacteria bacterium]